MDTPSTRDARLLRLHEVADRLAISKSMAWKLVMQQQAIRSCRIGRAIRVRPRDLEEFIENSLGSI